MNLKPSALHPFKANSLAVSIVLATVLMSGCDKEEVQVVAAPVIRPVLSEIVSSQVGDELSFNGVVRAAERAELAFQVGGRLINILVKEGDEVKQGQVLARLDARDATTALESAQLELKNTALDHNRALVVYEKSQAISKSELDTITTRLELARNHVEDATLQLEYTELKAPFAGIIGRKLVDNHIQIQANTPVFILHDLSDLEVVINIPHKVMLSSAIASKANAELSAIPGTLFPLALRTFGTQADAVSQTYPVVLGFDDLKGFRVLPGMAVKVVPSSASTIQNVSPNASQNASNLTIPLTAVVPDNQGKQFVWVVGSDNKAQKRFIELGALSKNRIVVKSNLAVGERVIIAGVSSVREGMQVRPYTDTNSGA
ncbi:efflux transporter, RND family, MFP subunit [Shewanella halifaxensis HAW-EB4]|uniref:Efflux transporter, RND family, MFP subunit n=1 Tax=Shewanella halifaxensis (strain HAW-EB4) TaxID=458817 RepID=B0TSF8_SHEHH|nr:efflux RND transporter periplasmic adaptor subunit [Shewanella halifaxensis]ABZ76538.1 efflux transporter, RND family, MFP subunit [Shewanella halifaxensis HAW-EB4]